MYCFLSRFEYRPGLRVLETSPRLGTPYRRMMRRYFDYTASDFDLSAHEGDVHLDLQDIRLPPNSLDVLLTPHVLEHVPDTNTALSEIFRVLASRGRMYLQVPLCLGTTRVPPTPEFHADNTKVFFNFGWDLTDRLKSAGFDVRVLVTEEFFELLSGHTAPVSPGDGQFDLLSLWKDCRVADLDVVADRERSKTFGFLPPFHFVTWECHKPTP
ncbi:MAG: class I SAM-dependent methyltransferase [Ilumatobacteraceae bacterium]